jgi:hypothetical protein
MSNDDDDIPIWNSVTTTDLKVNTGVDNTEKPPTPDGPTDSHVLSQVEQEDKGLIQRAGETTDITDVGWNNLADHTEPLIAGLSNEDLWMLIRRFDKVFLNNNTSPTKMNADIPSCSKSIMSKPFPKHPFRTWI